MSRGYKRALALAGQPCPPHQNKQVWYRYQAIAKDSRLRRIYTHNLPNSYVSLYELTRMSTPLLDAVIESGLLEPRVPYRLLRQIRITGKVPVTIWVEPDQVPASIRKFASTGPLDTERVSGPQGPLVR